VNRGRVTETVFLLLTLSALMVFTMHAGPAMDEDIWWHLRTGQLILDHRAVPARDLFSSSAMGKPWIVYSWLFDVLVARLFALFGYRGILALTAFAALAYTAWMTVFLARFTTLKRAVALAFSAYIALLPMRSPRPWLFTVLFFAAEFSCLWIARERNRPALLLPLVPLFALWANVHIQFVYGLALIGLFALDLSVPGPLRKRLMAQHRPALRSRWMWLCLTACLLATLLNPYGWNLYRVVCQYATQSAPMQYVHEVQSLPFRSPSNWLALFLIGAGIFVLGCARRKNILLLTALGCACYCGFHSQRDICFPVTLAVVALAAGMQPAPARPHCVYGIAIPLSFAIVFLFLAFDSRSTSAALDKSVAERFPGQASSFIESHRLEGPLFNPYDWGGYLIWRLPSLPVSIDGRSNLYAESFVQAVRTTEGMSDWSQNPDLKRARTIILDRDGALASILRVDPRFRLIYQDRVACVFQHAAQ
jgi:hypothetical protein